MQLTGICERRIQVEKRSTVKSGTYPLYHTLIRAKIIAIEEELLWPTDL